jgi:hypothetical protein
MKDLPFQTLFFIENYNLFVTTLRTITSKFILDECIYSFENIFLRPQKNYDKFLEFQKDMNGDVLYLEHPKHLKVTFENATEKPWDRYTWYLWIHSVYENCGLYPPMKKILDTYIKELNKHFEKSINHLDFLIQNVNDLKQEMIKPYMLMYYELTSENYNDVYTINWQKMLHGHVESMQIIFNQIINQTKKEQICLEIFETVKILSKNMEMILNDKEILRTTIISFKKEVHRILNHYTFYLNTEKINFKIWFLSLSQFLLHLKEIKYCLKRSMVKFNMVLFLATDTDELQDSSRVKYTSWDIAKPKVMKENQLNLLLKIHPFLRNVHHGEIFHTDNNNN